MSKVRQKNKFKAFNRLFQLEQQVRVLNAELAILKADQICHKDDFYRAFEDRFRGSRELIKNRVCVYLPFVQPLAQRHQTLKVIDLGCGRGEWLEVLSEAGISAKGVDIDSDMLLDCVAIGLNVQQGDALHILRQQPTSSSICISLMHVVEHLSFDVVRELVKEAKRVLVEDGILIMETPNPENFSVGACNFYTDPTHRNPLPPPLLAFVPEFYGFERIKVIRLQESDGICEKATYAIEDFLAGISPDYAVLAQVNRIKESDLLMGKDRDTLEQLWQKDYGVSYAMMTRKNSGKNNLQDD